IELLERQEAEQGPSAFLHYNLGSEYAAAGDSHAALERFRKAWVLLAGRSNLGRFGYVPSLAGRFVKGLRVCGHHEEALSQGDAPVDVAADVHALAAEGTAGVCFMLAVALYEGGAADVAETELRRVLELQPGNDHARVALGEALLSQGRLAEAAAEALAVDAEGPCGQAATRTVAFARLAAEDAEAAAEALVAAPAAGLPAGDVAAYE